MKCREVADLELEVDTLRVPGEGRRVDVGCFFFFFS